MSKMAELHAETNYPELTTAECVECGTEIIFASEPEFVKLAEAHVCIRLV